MEKWALNLQGSGKFGEIEQLILQITFGEYLCQMAGGIPMNQGEIFRLHDIGLSQEEISTMMVPAVSELMQSANSQSARLRLVTLMQEHEADTMLGASGLDDELEMIREQFRRYSIEKIEPFAHDWHLKDELIPMDVIDELAEMGVFGLQFQKNTEVTDYPKFRCALLVRNFHVGTSALALWELVQKSPLS